MPDHELVVRIEKLLVRQEEWLDQACLALDELDAAESEPGYDLSEAVEALAMRARKLATLVEERKLLGREWAAAMDIPPEQHARVTAKSGRVAARIEELMARQEHLTKRLQQLMAENQDEQARLGRGSRAVRGYRPERDDEAGYLDTKG